MNINDLLIHFLYILNKHLLIFLYIVSLFQVFLSYTNISFYNYFCTQLKCFHLLLSNTYNSCNINYLFADCEMVTSIDT